MSKIKIDLNVEKSLDFLNSIKNIDIVAKKIKFVGWLNYNLAKNFGTKAIIVGGSSVEMYSGGIYKTQDIDLVLPMSDQITAILLKVGFERKGRYWSSDEFDILVEAPGTELEGDINRVTTIEENVNGSIHKTHIIGVEDIIFDRIRAYVYWKDRQSGIQILDILNAINFKKEDKESGGVIKVDTDYIHSLIVKDKGINEYFLKNQDKLHLLEKLGIKLL